MTSGQRLGDALEQDGANQALHARAHFAALGLGLLLASLLLALTSAQPATNFEELALGQETKTLYARVGAAPIHCRGVLDATECIEGHARRGGRPVVLWLGNSQLHSVNQLRAGQETAALALHRALAPSGVDLLVFSQPNANLQEHLTLFAYLSQRLPVRALLLALVFDDLRETGIRSDLAAALHDPPTLSILERSEVGRELAANNRRIAGGDMAALHETVQERTETRINSWLELHSPLWASRPQARGKLVTSLLTLRNTLLGIDAQSTRRMIPGRMRQNLAAAEALLVEAQRQGIDALPYIVPLRNDVETPYEASEYAAFKREFEELAAPQGVGVTDLDPLVPGELWGQGAATTLGGDTAIDFMHFQAGGHALLADALFKVLEATLAAAE